MRITFPLTDQAFQRTRTRYGGHTYQHPDPSFETLQNTAVNLIDAALAPNTKKDYNRALTD